jgi:hypothetical protein
MKSLAKTLFEFAEIMDKIEENEGVIDDDIMMILRDRENLVGTKVDFYVNFIEFVRSQIEQKKSLIEKIRIESKKLDNLERKLIDNAIYLMKIYNLKSLNGNDRTLKLCNNGGKLPVEYADDFFVLEKSVDKRYAENLPEKYFEKKEIYVLKTADLREDLESGVEFDCVKLLSRSQHIKIK